MLPLFSRHPGLLRGLAVKDVPADLGAALECVAPGRLHVVGVVPQRPRRGIHEAVVDHVIAIEMGPEARCQLAPLWSQFGVGAAGARISPLSGG